MSTKFVHLESGGARLTASADLAPSLKESGFATAAAIAAALDAGGGPTGRAPTALIALRGRRERILLRGVRHGGWLAPLWGDATAGPGRALKELEVTGALRERGAPVPLPALVAATRKGPLWRTVVGTVFEEQTRDVPAFLAEAPEVSRITAATECVARAVRLFHDSGGRHRDLHVKNILLRDAAADFEVCIIDLDRARISETVSASQRMTELMRLYRSVLKRGLDVQVHTAQVRSFFDAYTGSDDALRERLLRYSGRERLRLAAHALGYRR